MQRFYPLEDHYPGEHLNLLLYQLKQKEEVKRVEKEIADRIKNPLEEGTPLFQRVFERCLSS